eukprot:2047669-Pyramimonas_sp.AAC.1
MCVLPLEHSFDSACYLVSQPRFGLLPGTLVLFSSKKAPRRCLHCDGIFNRYASSPRGWRRRRRMQTVPSWEMFFSKHVHARRGFMPRFVLRVRRGFGAGR